MNLQELLKVSESNYNALLLKGVALEGLDKPLLALETYRKATCVDSASNSAWQVSVSTE